MRTIKYETTITLPITITLEIDDSADPEAVCDALGRAQTERPGNMESASHIVIPCPPGVRASVAIQETHDLEFDLYAPIED